MAITKTPFPHVSPELVTRLAQHFPLEYPANALPDHRDMDRAVGRCDVVRLLRREMERQQQFTLE